MKILIIVMALFLVACNESKDSNPSPSNSGASDPATTLPSKTWVYSGETSTSAQGTVDVYASLLGCDKDNEYKFSALNSSGNGTVRYEEGANSCSGPANALIFNGTWRLSASKDSLFITQNGTVEPSKYKIKTITQKDLVIEFSALIGSEQTLFVYSYKAK